MSREDAAAKAKRYLAEGRLVVTAVSGDLVPHNAAATAKSTASATTPATAGGAPAPSAPTAAPTWPRSDSSPSGEPHDRQQLHLRMRHPAHPQRHPRRRPTDYDSDPAATKPASKPSPTTRRKPATATCTGHSASTCGCRMSSPNSTATNQRSRWPGQSSGNAATAGSAPAAGPRTNPTPMCSSPRPTTWPTGSTATTTGGKRPTCSPSTLRAATTPTGGTSRPVTAIAELIRPGQRVALQALAARLDELRQLADLMQEVPRPAHPTDTDAPPKRGSTAKRTKTRRPGRINGRPVRDIHIPS